ncbi:metallophosphoesterase [Loktanella sp. Alg231-35]|uniref:metallophosphoesterase n=1 Tax=Loktanella sp. Alg231-35 TaxID=1922220 RepID=UPI000D5562B2|nr:metallophosphoesterase [Loktanella sp. Alg231-35]
MTDLNDTSTLAPDTPFWAIGDVHGRDDLLEALLTRLMPEGQPIVLVGDYINKGPDSAGTLRRLMALADNEQIITLRGNHEELLLRFLRRPRRFARAFLRFGGRKTLASFGIAELPEHPALYQCTQTRNALLEAMPKLGQWLHSCPYVWQSGNVSVVHAGADPDVALDDQPPITFPWGHPNSLTKPRKDGLWVVHGHTPVQEVEITQRRIALDTQAHHTGVLSAVKISSGKAEVLQLP